MNQLVITHADGSESAYALTDKSVLDIDGKSVSLAGVQAIGITEIPVVEAPEPEVVPEPEAAPAAETAAAADASPEAAAPAADAPVAEETAAAPATPADPPAWPATPEVQP